MYSRSVSFLHHGDERVVWAKRVVGLHRHVEHQHQPLQLLHLHLHLSSKRAFQAPLTMGDALLVKLALQLLSLDWPQWDSAFRCPLLKLSIAYSEDVSEGTER